MPVILWLVGFGIVIKVVSHKDDVTGRFALLVQALPHHLQHHLHAPIQRHQVRLQQHRRDGIALQRAAHGRRQADRPGMIGEQGGERVLAQHAALVQRRQDGHLVMVGAPESAPVIQMDGEAVVPEELECLVVVAVHVAHEKVVDRQVYQVQ
jgi:hypothetical protein